MPPKDISDTKLYFCGKEMPCEIEASFTIDSLYINAKNMWRLVGAWDQLKWYGKLWLDIYSWFQDLKHKLLNK